jgi:hypothetical protein
MRIFLVNIKGSGVDLSAGKLNKEQLNNWSEIESNPRKLHDNKPTFTLYGALAEDAIIEIIDDMGELFETYAFADFMIEESDNLKFKSGSFYIKEDYHKGLFYQFELFLDNDESFDMDMITLKTKEHKGEQYIYSLDYDGDPLESIKSDTVGIEVKIQKVIC